MSNMEYWEGTLREVEILPNKTLSSTIKDLLVYHGEAIDEDESILDQLHDSDAVSENYMVLNGKLYRRDASEFDPDNLFEFSINFDGSISFKCSFYNGGGCLAEVLEDGLNLLEGEEDGD